MAKMPKFVLLAALACAVIRYSINNMSFPTPSIPNTGIPDEETSPQYISTLAENLNAGSGPLIYNISNNEEQYPNCLIPAYEKIEITFQVDTAANNKQMPYDPATPPGVEPGLGISVDALFSPDNWQTIYTQPAFYYQEFFDEVKSGKEWFYPSGNYSWKVRFSPNRPGIWQFKLVAQDASGVSESASQSFQVIPSVNPGFIRVSGNDPRYFEFGNGTYFLGLGYNMNYDHVNWVNPILDNQAQFQRMSDNSIQLVRIWLSEWSIYGSSWNPWNAINPDLQGQYIPYSGLTNERVFPGSEISMRIDANINPCMFIGVWKAPPAVKRDTTYRVRIRYNLTEIGSPVVAGEPFGFVAKTGGWLQGEGQNCNEPGTGTVVTSYQSQKSAGWQILEGELNTGNNDFLPNFYLVLENISQGTVYVDYVWIEENLGNGKYGPNIVYKPWMAHHKYMDQRNSYAFDKVLELAKQYGIYIRPVIDEKNEWISNRIDYQGNPIPDDPKCWDQDPSNDPNKCPGNQWFYGNGREMGKVRWLQKAWWRYLQARWGYSTNIHSWELLNEGDPASEQHYILADEFGKYMHQYKPDDHLVSTSFWHSFPRDAFWNNLSYPNVDFADIHKYIDENDLGFHDTALATYDLSMQIGAEQPGGAGKPVLRGETGFTSNGTEPPNSQFLNDSGGVWLHNYIWGGINAGGLIESYWYENYHIYKQIADGTYLFDHRYHYRVYASFFKNIPLNLGNYQDAKAAVSDVRIRAWGQTDPVSQRAHLWIQNKDHTWEKVVDSEEISPISGWVTVDGFEPGRSYILEWWDTYQPDPLRQVTARQTVLAQQDGSIAILVDQLVSDLAIKIFPDLSLAERLFLPAIWGIPGN